MRYAVTTYKVRLTVAEPPPERITSMDGAMQILRPLFKTLDADQEHFIALFLDNKHRVNSFKVLFSGGQTSSAVDPKILFRNSLLMGAAAIIVAHNHPTGDTRPSTEDIVLTKQIRQGCETLGLRLLDHIIVSGANDCDKGFSLEQNGFLKEDG